ncbi:hypothetical protein [Telluribacter sp.]|uniref:hypothetical protein n=1 Tax=Telluribacter sp. TaxID=1978767 RepID=UPI002E10147E|nr:hypothetical protein [Telluribacter sp.]
MFISSGDKGDAWVDAIGMFMAAAGEVYELLGKKGLGRQEFTALETTLISGDLAYHQLAGGHTSGLNWPTIIRLAERYFR